MNTNDLKLFTAITVAIFLAMPEIRTRVDRFRSRPKGGV